MKMQRPSKTHKKDSTLNHLNIKRVLILVILFLVMAGNSYSAVIDNFGKKRKSPKTLRSLARVYMAYGKYDKAKPLAEQAFHLASSVRDNDIELSGCYGDLAYLYKNLGQLEKAEQMCKKGMQLQKQAYFENHPYVAYSLKTLSGIYRDQQKYTEAENSLNEAFAIMLDTHGPDENSMASFYVEFAKIYTETKRLSLAELYYIKSLDMIHKSYGPEHLYTAGVLSSAAEYYSLCGKFDQAKTLINRAIAIQERAYGKEHHLVASSWLTLAKINYADGDENAARSLANKAVAAVSKTGNIAAIAKINRKLVEIGIEESSITLARNTK